MTDPEPLPAVPSPEPEAALAPAPAFDPAGFWVRGGALVIDIMVLVAASLVVAFSLRDMPRIGLQIVRILIPIFYYGMTVGAWGQTFGKMAAGISVVAVDGSPLGYPRAFGRYFATWLSGLTLGIGYLIVVFSSEKRALHDYVVGSRVIYPEPVGTARRTMMVLLGASLFLLPAAAGIFMAMNPGLLKNFMAASSSGAGPGSTDQFSALMLKSKEGATKGNLGALRSSAAIYYGDTEGVYPATLQGLLAPAKPGATPMMTAIPQVQVGDHPASSDVQVYGNEVCSPAGAIDGTKLTDSGKWGYVADKTSKCWGTIFVDCTHKDTKGASWYSY